MTRRTHPCRCCRSAVARGPLCDSCGAERGRHDLEGGAIIRGLFGSLGAERFQAALQAERIRARRSRGARGQAQPALILEEEA